MSKWLIVALMGLTFLSACSRNPVVNRVDPNQEFALTDRWNATDSRLVAQEMMQDMMAFPWYNQWLREQGSTPKVIVQNIRNLSHESIPVETFINDIKRAALQQGSVDFVASADVRQDIREERFDQGDYARPDTQAQFGQELGADFALVGSINSFVDAHRNRRVTSYQVDLMLINIETNQQVWLGQKKIQKTARF